MDIICYATARAEAPQDSLAGIQHCQDVDPTYWIEMNIQMTRDHVLILFHDDHLIIDGKKKAISDMSYDQLKDHDIGDQQRIPKLIQVLTQFTTAKFIFDIHSSNVDLVDLLITLLKNSPYCGAFLIASEYDHIVKLFKTQQPQWKYVAATNEAKRIAYSSLVGLERLFTIRSDYLIVPYKYNGVTIINQRVIKMIKRENKKIYAWINESSKGSQTITQTVQSNDEFQLLRSIGVHGVITDCPALLASRL